MKEIIEYLKFGLKWMFLIIAMASMIIFAVASVFRIGVFIFSDLFHL